MPTRVAVIQRPPALLDREATIQGALASIEEAAAGGAALMVFPEAFVPGYPTWVWRLRPGADMALAGAIHARLRANAVDLGRDQLGPLREAAARHGATVVIGLNEIDAEFSQTTLFNTVVIIGPDGAVLNRHRKLMPTNPERMVWGMGDGAGLRVVDTPAGRLGTLICWENYMPLARYALYAQGMEVLVAPTWDCGETWVASMRHIAREGGCWVIGTATALEGGDIPADFPERDRLFEADEWINDGSAVVAKPSGALAAGPLLRSKDILYAEIDPEAARRARRSLDVCGHYARPDVFSFAVDRRPRPPAAFSDTDPAR
jgi:nitrilase